MEPYADQAQQYAEFVTGMQGASPCFEEWARGVVADPEVLAWLDALPVVKRQPNIVFAAARWHGVPAPGPYDALRAALLGDDGTIRATILSRSTQTNEVGRLATLTPAFAALADGQPLALLEVGASAGLCLYPDRYDYAWETGEATVRATGTWTGTATGTLTGAGAAPLLTCDVTGPAPLPPHPPTVAWRGGIDLNPLPVTDDDAMRWLTILVWPEQEDRRRRLEQAIANARQDPPANVRGNLLDELPALVDRAAAAGPVVVFHSAVVAYLEPADRERFHRMMTGLVADGRCHWVSNEGMRVLPAVTATGPAIPEDTPMFVLGVDGRAVAWTHGHGRSMTWLG